MSRPAPSDPAPSAPQPAADDAVLRALRDAPYDDEPETPEEAAAVEEARRDVAAGRVLSHDVVRERWLRDP